jgi:glutamate synthase domain-containing protein 2
MRNKVLLSTSILFVFSLFYMLYNLTVITGIFTTIFLSIFLFSLIDVFQIKHSLKRNYPILARLRWVFESERDKIRQYFNESDLDGTPYNREKRSIIYQRSKNEIETIPFGTQHDVYEKGHTFISHSMFPKNANINRVEIGSKFCQKPYSSSILNISAMSFGSLSHAAITALNKGAKEGGFYHNTGEGGISDYHLNGGDLVFQIGTGYFGCGKTIDDKRVFDENSFIEKANKESVKMIEIKLSQGAKPGHGGMLPAKKNTEEIAKIRGINPYTRVESPPFHDEFNDFSTMLKFIEKLRKLSGGKPVGIKMCVTTKKEIEKMFKTFDKESNYPDFITIDGSEGGTGSAPLEFTNNVGMPLMEGLAIVFKYLRKYDFRDDIKLIASGKIVDTFDILKVVSMGANIVNMARPFMMSMGCIQARECNKDTCPVGIATQNNKLIKGLVVEDKYKRVANFHKNTLRELKHLIGAVGLERIEDVKPYMVSVRDNDGKIKKLNEIYEYL